MLYLDNKRCDLYIISNDNKKKEKIASGLVNPFIAHLKTAQLQIQQGGYSIFLQPPSDDDASWFTKSTLQSFVRFVSTPEILERVCTIESEILQIQQAITIQGNNNILPSSNLVSQSPHHPISIYLSIYHLFNSFFHNSLVPSPYRFKTNT